MITHLLAAELILEKIAMAKKPTPHNKWLHGTEAEKKLKGIPIGSYEDIKNAAGKTLVKPKVSRKTSVSQKIAQRSSKKVTVKRGAR